MPFRDMQLRAAQKITAATSKRLNPNKNNFLTIGIGGGGIGLNPPIGTGPTIPAVPTTPIAGGTPTLPPPSSPPGGIGGALCQFIQDPTWRRLCELGVTTFGAGGGTTPAPTPPPTPRAPKPGRNGCPEGQRLIAGRCVDPGAIFPGGDPFVSPGPDMATTGAFGLPAIVPSVEQRTVRDCPDGMVLGRDNLCYPKAVLPGRSRFRKWRRSRKPMFTAGDLNAIRRAQRLKGKAKDLAQDVGFKVTRK